MFKPKSFKPQQIVQQVQPPSNDDEVQQQQQQPAREDDDASGQRGNADEKQLDAEALGKRLLEEMGIKPGEALKEGGRTVQYRPTSVGGFATSATAVHDVKSIKDGDFVIYIGPQQPQQQQKGSNSSTSNGNKTDATSSSAAAPPPPARITLIAEEDNEDDDDGEAGVAAFLDALGRRGGVVLQSDAKQLKVQFCGTGENKAAPRGEWRGATQGEEKQLVLIRTKRLQAAKLAGNRHGRSGGDASAGFAARGRPEDDEAKPNMSSWLLPGLLVNKKKKPQFAVHLDDDDDADNNVGGAGALLTVMNVIDGGARATLSSGETLSASDLEPVVPDKLRHKAVVVVDCAAGFTKGQEVKLTAMNLQAKTVTVTAVGNNNGGDASAVEIPLSCVCAMSRF